MKVIKHGKSYNEKNHICTSCGCEFTFTEKDVRVVSKSEIYEGIYYSLHCEYIRCPECRKRHDLIFSVNGVED